MEKTKLNRYWTIQSWKAFEILQQPNWPNIAHYNQIIKKLQRSPSLIVEDAKENSVAGNYKE